MKRDSDFWFWIATMSVMLAMFGMWLAQELNFFSQFFAVLFVMVLVLATGYMGVSLVRERHKRPVGPPVASAGQALERPGRHTWRRTTGLGAFAGMMALLLLPKDGFLPQWALIGLSVVLFSLWIWYELVGSKVEEE